MSRKNEPGAGGQATALARSSDKVGAANSTTGRRDGPESAVTTRKGTVRLSLDVSSELNELIEKLAAATNSSKSDVLRRAISLMEVAVEAKRQGKRVGIAEKDQPLATEIIWL